MASKAPCPLCGVEISIESRYCKHCKQNLPVDEKGQPLFSASQRRDNVEAQRKAAMGGWYCQQCGTVADPKTFTKGSFLIEVFLWLMLIIPGVLYSLWRLTTKWKGCPKCHAPNMIPASSPIAQRAINAAS
jgi:hypothetical protein